MWHRILTFGSEGTGEGNFCRPWGVAIARYMDLWDPWSHSSDSLTGFTHNTVGSSNNNNIVNSGLTPSGSTYLIGIADRSNNRIQLFKFDPARNTVTFLHMFGDGPGARHGQFDRPAGIVFNNKLGQIIVADKDNHRVQVFDLSGSYLFKFGERGSKCGQFCYPWDIDVCKTTHNILVSDTRNRRVQMFNNLGRYLMHFNQPLDSPRGVTFLSQTEILVSDFNKHRLLLITQNLDHAVSSTTTSLMSTNGNDYLNSIQQQQQQQSQHNKYHQQSHQSKFVGFGEGSSWGEFLRPQGATSNGSVVYCSDSRNNRVTCWNKETETFSYINKDVVDLDRPAGLAAIDSYIVIVDFGNNRVHICQSFTPISGSQVQSWHRVLTFGTEGVGEGNFCRPWGVAIARYVDLWGSWSFNSEPSSGFASGDGSSNNSNNILNSGLAPAGSTYLIGIADRSNNRIQLFKFDPAKKTVTFLHMFGDGPGARHGQFDRPAGLVFNTKLEQIIVADKDNHRVQVFDLSGSYLFKFGERGSKCGQFCYPWDIDVCKTTHNILVSDTRNRRVQMFNNLGRYLIHFNQPLDSPRGVTFLSQTEILVSDFNKHRLLLITQNVDHTVSSTTTSLMSTNGNNYLNSIQQQQQQQSQHNKYHQQSHQSKFVGFGEGSSWGEFLRPQGATSNGSVVYCSDSRNNRVTCWNKETETFSYINKDVVDLDRPAGLAAIDSYIVIVDFGNNRVHICKKFMH